MCGSWWCGVEVHQVWLLRLFLKLDVFGCDESWIGQRQPAPAPQRKAPSKGRQFLVDDVVVFEVLLQLLDIVHFNNHAQPFADEQEEGINQGLGGLAADVGFLPFAVLLHVFICQALELFVGELHTDGFFGLAGRNKDGQLLTFGGDVVGSRREPCGLGGVRRGLQQLHDFVQSFLLLCGGHGIYVFSDFNNPLYIRQQGLQLPDNPCFGVRHGIQAQGVAVQQHVAQIFLTCGFDNCVLRFKGVGAEPVQKLSKHSKLVEAGGPVHALCVYRCVCVCFTNTCEATCDHWWYSIP